MSVAKTRPWALTLLSALSLCATANAANEAAILSVQSPDGRLEIRLGRNSMNAPTYAVWFKGKEVIAPSMLGLHLDGGGSLSQDLQVTDAIRSSGDKTYTLIVGKTRTARDHYNELSVGFLESAPRGRKLEVIFRAYDDGAAFRYRLPAQAGLSTVAIRHEQTHFDFSADYACWALNLGRFGTSHEGEYDEIRASQIRAHHLIELPLVCKTGEGDTTLAIAEADLRDFGALYLAGRSEGGWGAQAVLSPRLDDPRLAVRVPMHPEGVVSPWRTILIADHPGRLIESTLVTNLNPDPPPGDTSWIKPGKAAWDWWSGPLAPGIEKPGMNNETMKHYIDTAARMGLSYMLIDDGWYIGSGGAGTAGANSDITRSIPQIDLPGLVKYAADRKVGLFLWLHWKLADARMDEAFALYRQLGIRGVKIDFMDRDDQEMVDFYHRVLQKTAEHRLLLDLHGAYRPTGLIRTYPHYLTQEGVMGAEYNKWSRRVTATHNVTLPFTRMLLGPMDYTPGGFRNVTPEQFSIRFHGPQVMTTRAQGLAMYVVYDSPFACVSDSPDMYDNSPGSDFLSLVPATWDETRVLSGDIGKHIVIARRYGREWFIGAMTNESARTVSIPLTLLGKGRFTATIWSDGATPTELNVNTRAVTKQDAALEVPLAASGGAVVRISPRK